jgi:hypothetical protein
VLSEGVMENAQPTLAAPECQPLRRWERPFLILLAVGTLSLLLPLLGRAPRAFVDDSWSSPMAAYTLASEGRPRNPGQMGMGGVDTYLVEPRLFASLIGAAIYRAAGFGLVQGRLAAVAFALLFVLAVYGTMRRLLGPLSAAAVATISAIDPWFFVCGRTFREEIFLAALLWLGAWLLLSAHPQGGGRRSFLGGLCIGVAHWTHPNALVFTAAFGGAAVVVAGLRPLAGRRFLFALLGLAAGIAPYVAYVLYVQATTEVRWFAQVERRAWAFARPWSEIVLTEKLRWANFIRWPQRALLLILYVVAAAWAAFRGRRADRAILLFVLFAAVLMPLYQPVATSRYYVVLVPALAALVWRCLPVSAEGSGPARPRAAAVVTTFALLVVGLMSLAPTVVVMWAYRDADYDHWTAPIVAAIPKDATVMANTMFWTALHDRKFVSSNRPSFGTWQSAEEALGFIRANRPAYVVQASPDYSGLDGIAARTRDLDSTTFGQACERLDELAPARIVLEQPYHRDFGVARVWKMEW